MQKRAKKQGRRTYAYWLGVDFDRPVQELATEHGVTIDAIYYHKRQQTKLGHRPQDRREAAAEAALSILSAEWEAVKLPPVRQGKADIRYAVLFEAKEARSASNKVITSEGELFWVTRSIKGELGVMGNTGRPPPETKTFDTQAQANSFIRWWDAFPWHAQPRSWRVIRVRASHKLIQAGWDAMDKPEDLNIFVK